MSKKILLIRTFRSVGTGGPVIPIEMLYIASTLINQFSSKVNVKILDAGLGDLDLDSIKEEVSNFFPNIVLLNGLIWEADLIHSIAAISKRIDKNIFTIIQGQLPTLVKETSLLDSNIDCCIIGEAENTVAELLKALLEGNTLSGIKGIAYRVGHDICINTSREYIENLDNITISPQAWDLIDIKEYAKYPNWNGSLKEKFYMPILTSRGCPFDCTFCCNRDLLGKNFRARSPENVFAEIKFLNETYKVKEFHFYDAVFNFDAERAKKICNLIIDSGLKLSLAFPHGIRAEIMTDELISLFKKAGTYKLVYGIETASPRLQKEIKKNLDLEKTQKIISKTTKTGIIVGGYFMLGFPSETIEEIYKTIDFAVNSNLDWAAFFKVTSFEDAIKNYCSAIDSYKKEGLNHLDLKKFSYYSKERSYADISVEQLNTAIMDAQIKFYFNFKRIYRGLLKAPKKLLFLKNLITALGLIVQSYLYKNLTNLKEQNNKLGSEKS